MTLCTLGRAALLATALAATAAATAQDAPAPTASLDIPANPEFFTSDDPSVRKATAIVNGSVITGTDIDHRLALVVLSNEGRIPSEELQRLRAQVLRNLVDETLQIQAAEAQEIKIEPSEVNTYFAQYARNFGKNADDFAAYLKVNGSSDTSVKRQIQGEIAWTRLQSRQIRPFVNVSDEEVQGIIDRLKEAKGTEEYRVAEIFLPSAPETMPEARANATRIVQQIRGGANFPSYARQFSEASTAAVGGDLGWVRAEQLPAPLAAAAQQMPVGAISEPIEVPGGVSIIAIQDKRQVLTTDPRDAVLSLKQLSVDFPEGTTRDQAGSIVEKLTLAGRSMGGCGGAEATARQLNAEVVTSDSVKVRELPPALQEMLLKMNIGQTTNPFGSLEDGVRILVLCGRDDPEPSDGPSFDQVYAQLDEERTNRRARRYLRDLRRDAVVDYR